MNQNMWLRARALDWLEMYPHMTYMAPASEKFRLGRERERKREREKRGRERDIGARGI
jgi:hypothetical protein